MLRGPILAFFNNLLYLSSMKYSFVFFVILLPSLILCSCSDSRRDRQLIVYTLIAIDGVSTSDSYNFFNTPIETLLFNSPAITDINYQTHNILIKEARHSSDRKVWEIRLRDGIRFHNGQLLTAGDVVFSIKKRMEAGSARYSAIREIKAANDRDLLLTLDIPLTDISDLLDVAVYPGSIFKADEPWQKTLLKNPIGSGPFRFRRWLNKGVEFTANDDYFEGRPKLDRVICFYEEDEDRKLNLLLKGEADVLLPISPKAARFLERDSRFYVTKATTPFFTAIFLNNKSQLFKEKGVRKAISMAIDREWLTDKGLGGAGAPASGPFLRGMLPDGYIPSTYGYNPKKAVQLLKEAGWNGSKKRFKFKLYYISDINEMKRVADVLTHQLFEAGIEVECVPVNINVFMTKQFISGDYDAILSTMNAFSPEEKWESRSIHGSKNYNLSNYSNKDVDSLFDKARNSADDKERKRIYGEIDRIVHEDAPGVFLYTTVWFSAISKRFKGGEDFKGDPYSFFKIRDWSANEDIR